MPVKVYKPTTPGRRFSSVDSFSDVTKKEPEKSLIRILRPQSGRNNQGIITVRHKSGGAKKFYRLVDFKRQKFDISAEVLAIEYDPNRSPRIALIKYDDGTKSYILCPTNLKVGDKVMSSDKTIETKNGCRMPLMNIPTGLFVYNIELTPGKGGQLVRSAGMSAQLVGFEGEYAQIKLPSGEIRAVLKKGSASVGVLGNSDRRLIRWGKAGRMRHRGIKPTVKGKNMNPVDHPHGGGEGHSPIGQKRGPQTVYGKTAMGVRTRKPEKWSNKFIIKSRRK
ncbi:MAG: 50S ribosomal protein L2 [Candidatus Magasanikbacteria bacterium CG10_big_fil_rev_8_21_14_0_10_36_32]|uniref:Large ribosomal subunit protein uL2 n=1 Tax=Candidatus Magasanikbacteria bacterium CG10_big_fil_rev_8_21_14_0_10_36_32 TaxID=1974646 RepID=A0A2M6W6Q8_9BACT|nr:MAG: 50S ribosomal protein L2 [Candidatus Magasanikbacteria bacterium CG10_big_fil_rev_8_21_14_0_10_36_32]